MSFTWFQVVKDSKAETLGIAVGDLIVATSATAGDQMWSHDTVEGETRTIN